MSQRQHKAFLAEMRRTLERVGVCPGAAILVALSGGSDSVALLHGLVELREASGFRLAAAHLNHALRGAESDRDQCFCDNLCARLNIDFIVERATGLAPHMPNLEEAARRARHEFLDRAALQTGSEYVAVGHHADDQAETVLMRLLRGAGVGGLSAMAEIGPGRLIRPLLSLSRRDILSYLEEIGAAFVTDASNFSSALLRNRIRHDLLPTLNREYVPGISRRLAALAAEMQSVDGFLLRAAAQELSAMLRAGGELDLSRFARVDPALRVPVLRQYLAAHLGSLRRVNRDHLEGLSHLCLAGPANGQISLPGGRCAVRQYDRLRIADRASAARANFSTPLAFEGTTEIAEAALAFEASLVGAEEAAMPADQSAALFDIQALAGEGLTARNFKPGDRIRPLGMAGTRKVKDVFIDKKLPPRLRGRFPVVAMGARIVWLPGILRGDGALVSTASERVLRIRARHLDSADS
jgi:tRNA(Ile)-lysidine synthase